MTTKFTTPQINLNGTSAESIYDELSEARKQICRAEKALRVVTVNSRDFQTLPPGSWVQAKTEHCEALNRIDDALDWVDAWMMAIQDQMST